MEKSICLACEGAPQHLNNPCAVCGTKQPDMSAEPVGYVSKQAIERFQQRIAELESQLEAIGAGGVTQGQRLIEAARAAAKEQS